MLWDAPELMFHPVSCDMMNISTATTTKQHTLHHLHSICRCRHVTKPQRNLPEAASSDGSYQDAVDAACMLSHCSRAVLAWLPGIAGFIQTLFTQLCSEVKRPSGTVEVAVSLYKCMRSGSQLVHVYEHCYMLLQIPPGLHCSGQLHHCSHSVHPSTAGVCGPPDEGRQPWKRGYELPHGMRQVSVPFGTISLGLVHLWCLASG